MVNPNFNSDHYKINIIYEVPILKYNARFRNTNQSQ